MATGLKAWRRGQLGKEATPGTPVVATRILHYDTMEIADNRELYQPEEELNTLALHTRSQIINIPPADITIEGDLTFEDIVYWLQGALKGAQAPTQPDPAADLYTFEPLFTATNAQTTYTIEGGDNEEAIEVEFAYVEKIEITWATNEPVKVTVTLKGRQVTATTFTGALTVPTVETASGGNVSLYADPLMADVGDTVWPDCAVVEGKITINSGLTPVHRSGCGLYFAKVIEQRRTIIEAEITVEENATADAFRTHYHNATPYAWRVKFEGTEIDTGFDRELVIDFWAPLFSFVQGEDNGVNTRVFTLMSQYDTTSAKEAVVTVQNALNAVTEF